MAAAGGSALQAHSEQLLTSLFASMAVKRCSDGHGCRQSSEHPACGARLPFRTQRPCPRGPRRRRHRSPGSGCRTLQALLASPAAAAPLPATPCSDSRAVGPAGRQRRRNEEYHCVLLRLLRTQRVCAPGSPRGRVFQPFLSPAFPEREPLLPIRSERRA